jgi:hypothetical protein
MKLIGMGREDAADGAVLSKGSLLKTGWIQKAARTVAFFLGLLAWGARLPHGQTPAQPTPSGFFESKACELQPHVGDLFDFQK